MLIDWIKNRIEVHVVVGLYILLFLLLLIISLFLNEWHLVYAVDDAYIHLAIAKHFALNGVWGVTPFEFSSSSSSPLWTLLLAGLIKLFGNSVIFPLLLNFIGGAVAIFFASDIIREIRQRVPVQMIDSIYLFQIVLFLPLFSLVFTGMEHVWHVAAMLFFLRYTIVILDANYFSRKELLLLVVSAIVICGLRYESYAILLLAVLLFIVRGRFLLGVTVLLAGFAPMIIYAAVSISHGWFWAPNSVILKSAFISGFSLTNLIEVRLFEQMMHNPHMVILGVLTTGFWLNEARVPGRFWDRHVLIYFFASFTLFAHILFGETFSFYRYEAYTFLLAGIALYFPLVHRENPHLLWKWLSPRIFVGLLLMTLFLFPGFSKLGMRVISNAQVPRATANIYQQQVQMGDFLSTYYTGETIAANDIGAINYLADIDCIDLVGLANLDVAKAIQSGGYSEQSIDQLCREAGVSLAVIYDSMLEPYGGVPKSWRFAGSWTIEKNIVCGDRTVKFYAVNPDEFEPLRTALKTYRDSLPKSVSMSIQS